MLCYAWRDSEYSVYLTWSGITNGLEWTIVLPFCLWFSLRPHSHCGKCERSDGKDSTAGLGGGGDLASCPTLQATGDQATVIHWVGEESCTRRLLGQHSPWCLLGETCKGALQVGRGESTISDQTILAARYMWAQLPVVVQCILGPQRKLLTPDLRSFVMVQAWICDQSFDEYIFSQNSHSIGIAKWQIYLCSSQGFQGAQKPTLQLLCKDDCYFHLDRVHV